MSTKEIYEDWAYRLGLKLDKYIPFYGISNFERIEKAVIEYIKYKEKEESKLKTDLLTESPKLRPDISKITDGRAGFFKKIHDLVSIIRGDLFK